MFLRFFKSLSQKRYAELKKCVLFPEDVCDVIKTMLQHSGSLAAKLPPTNYVLVSGLDLWRHGFMTNFGKILQIYLF